MSKHVYQKGDWVVSLVDSFSHQVVAEDQEYAHMVRVYSPERDVELWRGAREIRPFVEGDPSPYDTEYILGVPYGDGYNAAVQARKQYEIDYIFAGWMRDPCYDFEWHPEFAWCLPQLIKLREAYLADIEAQEQAKFEKWANSKGFSLNDEHETTIGTDVLVLLHICYDQQQEIERLKDRLTQAWH